jgi:tryptophanyl-tRNA synthetase|tara:strand:+ start:1223 stop:2236 length:1014 start_codon:yes stop_codon:yes gene_type:complete
MSILLTGITTSGTPHLGNYVGAIKPSLSSIKDSKKSFLFLADYHSLIKQQNPRLTHQSSLEIASAWLACGLNPDQTFFYRQSKVPQILELNWVLSNVTSKGLLNRAHAYKAAQDSNKENNDSDLDKGITAGLFNYPVLMAADILIFNANEIPVGSDQKQHIEMTRDIAARFNHIYGEVFNLPEAKIQENTALLPGFDGRKMSKSYGNFIELFSSEKALQKSINKIQTDSKEPGESKSTEDSNLFSYFQAFLNQESISTVEKNFLEGMGWGDLKKELFTIINDEISPYRENYFSLLKNPEQVEEILRMGERKVLDIAESTMVEVREKIGIKALNGKKE